MGPSIRGQLIGTVLLVAGLLASAGRAAEPPLPDIERSFPNLSFVHPLYITGLEHEGNDWMFVVEQPGTIHVFPNDQGVTSSSELIDLSGVVGSSAGERGLLGLAFDPDFATNGYLYVNYTEDVGGPASCEGPGQYVTHIERYTVTSFDPPLALTGSAHPVMQFHQPFSNHNGGMLAFGPVDGMLYISTGDGGLGGDPCGSGQNMNSLLGAILRIDPTGDDFPLDPDQNYAVPTDNPFVDVDGADEVYHYGLRNPWRFSFDRDAPHDMWIGDVGQVSWEEIDFAPGAVGGINFGWAECEGNHGFGGTIDSDCQAGNLNGYEPPILENPTEGGHSITGGYVYHGSRVPSIDGAYVFADFRFSANGDVFAWDGDTIDPVSGLGIPQIIGELNQLNSFGEDASGELYMVTRTGEIHWFVPEPSATLLGVSAIATLFGLAQGRRRARQPRPSSSASSIARASRAAAIDGARTRSKPRTRSGSSASRHALT